VSAKAGIPDTIGCGWPEGEAMASEGLAEPDLMSVKADEAAMLDLADDLTVVIFRRLQRLGKGSRAHAISVGRYSEINRLVRPEGVVDGPPAVEPALAVAQIAKAAAGQDLSLEGAMEALILALGLGMIGPPMGHADAQLQQPDREWRPG